MGLDEKLFEFAQRTLVRWKRRRESDRAPEVHRDAIDGRLRALAAVVAQRPIEIHAAEGCGGVRDDALFLPTTLACTETYVFRVAYGIASWELGFRALATDRNTIANDVASLLAVPRTVAALEHAWHGARRLRQELSRAQLAAAPQPDPNDPLACWSHALLGMSESELRGRFTADVLDRVRGQLARHPGPDELATQVRAALESVRPRRKRRASAPDLTLWGRLMAGSRGSIDAIASPTDDAPVGPGALPTGTERDGRPREHVERVEPREQPDGDNPLVHVFEKLFTAEEYQDGDRSFDGADELDAHADALEELDLRRVVRTAEGAASVYRADCTLDSALVDIADDTPTGPSTEVLHYDEWDEKRRQYRPDWCTLHVTRPALAPRADSVTRTIRRTRQRYSREIRQLRADLARLDKSRAIKNRQRFGTDVDLDAVVDHHAALRAARALRTTSADDRLYLARRPHRPELATLILLDQSLSTDSWVDGRRVHDVAREAIFVLGEVFGPRDLAVAVGGFHSNSRRDCHYHRFKDFDDPWHDAYARLLDSRPTGYTRIGPAVRHATSVLAHAPVRRRLLLLISDGKPTDYDHYEGRHGIADVRQALRETHRSGIATFALAIDSSAKHYLPALFGRGGFEILPAPRRLPQSLVRLHERLLA